MKREGRQHGLVATAYLPPCNSLDHHHQGRRHRHHQQPTAGIFIKVSQRPTNHSKYTSRCTRPRCSCCHNFPACKAKDKTKGSQKARSSDVVTNYRLVSWRVADDDDARPGLNISGSSASRILDHLDNDDYDEGEEEDEEDRVYYSDEYDGSTHDDDDHQQQHEEIELMISPRIDPRIEEIEEEDSPWVGGGGGDGDGDGDGLSYCNVGIVWEQINAGEDKEVEGWCLVQEF